MASVQPLDMAAFDAWLKTHFRQEAKSAIVSAELMQKMLPLEKEEPTAGGEGEELKLGEEDERTSDDDIGGRVDLVGLVRDKIDHAVAEGLAARVDEIAAAKNREEVLAFLGLLSGAYEKGLLLGKFDLSPKRFEELYNNPE
jgi:hypothetical protein